MSNPPGPDETPEKTPEMTLEKTGVTIRDGAAEDAVAGVSPRWVALPESTEEVSALLRATAGHDLAVVATGGGTKLHWGLPPERCDLLIDTCCLTEPVEHTAGDLVARVPAGVTMDALAVLLADSGQELALDVPLAGATVGGTLATATAGPRRFRYGTARDLLIGITVVLADGTVARSGGRVVKNVAGYDLGKLFTGSYGTLGVITDATFRLHPLPAQRHWTAFTAPGPGEAGALVAALAASQSEPSAVEIDWPQARGPLSVSALFEGVAAEQRAEAVAVLGEPGGLPQESGGAEEPDECLIELRVPPAGLSAALTAVGEAAGRLGLRPCVRGAAASGVLSIGLPAADGLEAFVSALRADSGGRLVVLAAPEELSRRIDPWGETGALGLMRRVKERFDPGRRMSPGRFVGGI
ncbi:FAD-binding oxidoreductase [Spongiactinospora sp. TRM90649]|uniref:FAD-binding oxidoreductase n=1 Tax=Spongiactinospora sp. TRM90649 TaxID=3031114 RepID=UPI0023F72F1A|nr:FAD-binding oxidoreductase [Spongiactinospora sp. TRM90649]MDF5754083.1 FAD-binding oxidoreductase [Spongiactinospora sp. TRM90649]